MKKFIPILAAMGLVLAVSLVYAEDMRSVIQDDGIAYAALDNGVTFVGSVDSGIQCEGAAAGGMEPTSDFRGVVEDDALTYIAPDNGVSFSSEALGPKCSWARGLGHGMKLDNVVTIPGGNTLSNTYNIP
ncbi:MAG TPA: hypothetical protein VEM40_14515 [Nitrospirota bacterium]|nr:hypothetical protein [Nitrospirota bacterium]